MSTFDDGPVRGFPAFPPAGRGGRRARTWWGTAWVRALEDTSLDREPLRQGRRYAGTGRVGAITVSPGRIAASVHDGTEDVDYQTRVRVEPLTDAEWARFLDEVTRKAGHVAALLDREMPRELVAAADDAGVRLLPGLGDLQPDCDCPDWEFPCRHAAALCYQVAWLLDADPFVLLLIRGRSEQEVRDAVRRRSVRVGPTTAAPVGADTDAGAVGRDVGLDAGSGLVGSGTPALEAYARPVPPLPADPPALPAGGTWPGVPAAPGVDPDALRMLAADAATRAVQLLAWDGVGSPPGETDLWRESVRLAASYPDVAVAARLCRAGGWVAVDLARAARAWEYGGAAGLDVLETPASPPRAVLARAAAALASGWEGEDPPEVTVWRNRWTLPGRGVQVRYGPDGRWYPYREENTGDWWPAGPYRPDPAAALAELLDA
ncbi:SWIM zinc finger family protein [Micromonospora sp. NPDC003197]